MDNNRTNKRLQISGGIFSGKNVAIGQHAHVQDGGYTVHDLRVSNDSQTQQPVKVLLVFANPWNTSHLRLGTEERAIREAIRLSRYRDSIALTVRQAATIHDLRRALLDEEFQIVHLAGHGTESGLILEDEMGRGYMVPQKAL